MWSYSPLLPASARLLGVVSIGTTWASTEDQDGCLISGEDLAFDFPTILDYTQVFLDRSAPAYFLEQYKSSTNLNNLALAILPQFSNMEQTTLNMMAYSYASNASGVNLDNIASIFNVSRGSMNDSELRALIFKKSANRGQPTPDKIMEILRGFYGVEAIKYVSGENGHIVFESYPVLNPEDVYDIIGAGISLEFREISVTVLYAENDFAIVDEFGEYIYVED